MALFLGIGLSTILGIGPMTLYAVLLTFFDRYEKEPPLLLFSVFMWGMIVSAGSALILNTLFGLSLFVATGSEGIASIGSAVLSAPLVEETVKGLAVFAVFVYFYQEFDSILDGIIYGSLVGFGFAAAENVNYIFFYGFTEAGFEGLLGVALIRVIVIAFLHAMLTSFTGIGFAVARLNKGLIRFIAPVLGFGTAVFLHAFHNLLSSLGVTLICLLGSLLDWAGFAGMFIFILYLVYREGQIMRRHLREEIDLGHLSAQQYQVACSITGQMAARLSALFGGRWGRSSNFYDLCGELAFKKYELARVGPEPGTQAIIDRLRGQLTMLSPGV